MCSLDLETCPVWRETPRVARKQHCCFSCGSDIRQGEAYLSLSYVFDGSAGTEKACFPCWWVLEVFGSAHAMKPMPSNLYGAVEECIGDGEDDWRPEMALLKRRYRVSASGREQLRRKWGWRRPEARA